MNFSELNLEDSLLEGLDAMGFARATPIQEKAIPSIMQGKDLIACAQTGTGKTAAFILPILNRLIKDPSPHLNTLIIVPTRELAIQIEQSLEGFAYFTGVNFLAIYGGRGGEEFSQEKKALTAGANIIIATPGRLIAHLGMKYVKMDNLQHLILDEADRMLDMGFVNDILKIIDHLPQKRQTLMFSATMPAKIRKFANQILSDPEYISIAVSKPTEGVVQGIYKVEEDQKLPLLKHLLYKDSARNKRILIFCRTKSNTKEVTSLLKKGKLNAEDIHSDLDQQQRNSTLLKFKNGEISILVATDILSRGIDVKDINLVINYDMPGDPEDYIHRIGRTARADSTGTALTFVMKKDLRKLKALEHLMEKKVFELRLPKEIPPTQISSKYQGSKSKKSKPYRKKRKR